jgi:hypothetical protein
MKPKLRIKCQFVLLKKALAEYSLKNLFNYFSTSLNVKNLILKTLKKMKI